MTDTYETPCLVETARGVSVLYNKRHLFSRFDPQKAFLTILQSTPILDESLILCISPVLDFPINAIFQKIEDEKIQNCFVLAIEKNKILYDFFQTQIEKSLDNKAFASLCVEHETDISFLLEGLTSGSTMQGKELPAVLNFKRVILLEASSEVNQHRDFYTNVARFTQNSISQFWKNRMTLVRLGKLFSKNTLRNASRLKNAFELQKGCIAKPILIVGAGTSLEDAIPFIKEHNDSFFVLSIAAAVQSLVSSDIKIDAIVTLEGQYATDKAYVGLDDRTIPLFADIASRPNAQKCFDTVSFFISEYTKSPLLERIKKTFPNIPVFPPLGSVGITATELALYLRKDTDIPVFFAGLDFSFPVGKTHAKESPHIKESLHSCNRLSPIGNVAMSFRHGAFLFKNQPIKLVSDSGLKVYADLFNERYKNEKSLYSLSSYGLVYDGFYCDEQKAISILSMFDHVDLPSDFLVVSEDSLTVEAFYEDEKERLEAIKSMLTGTAELNEAALLKLLKDCSYLYDHFPDGHKGANLRQDFLNRVRSEVDVFLKSIEVVTNY